MRIVIALFFILSSLFAHPQDFSEYHKEVFSNSKGSLPYRILYPALFDTSKTYPLIIFLHGAFEKGTDNNAQLNIGGSFFLREENRQNFPAFVIFPQCPVSDGWAYFDTKLDSSTGLAKSWNFPFLKEPAATIMLLKGLLDSLTGNYNVDRSRIYIGGLSQGGMGVYDMIARYPEVFAAGFPICGAGKVSTVKNFASKTALWIFHGSADEIVPAYFSRDFYRRLKKLGADVRYSEYRGVHHNSWVNAFSEKDLLPWLFSKTKKQ